MSRERGFTLLELLVSLTLLALLTVALVAALRFGASSWRKSQDANLSLHKMRLAEKEISAGLSRLYPRFVDRPPDPAYVDFDGSPTQIRFFTPDPRTGFLLSSVLEAVGTAPRLALHLEQLPDIWNSPNASDHIVLDGLSDVAFDYYGQADGEGAASWHASWQRQPGLPKLIRIRMANGNGSMPIAELVVSPRVAADVGCVYDPVIKFCRGRK